MYWPVEEPLASSEIFAVRVPAAVGVKVTVMVQGVVPVDAAGQKLDGVELTVGCTAETVKSPGLAPPMAREAAGDAAAVRWGNQSRAE